MFFIIILLFFMILMPILSTLHTFAKDFKRITGHKIKFKNVFKVYNKYIAYCKTCNMKAFYKNLDRKEL